MLAYGRIRQFLTALVKLIDCYTLYVWIWTTEVLFVVRWRSVIIKILHNASDWLFCVLTGHFV